MPSNYPWYDSITDNSLEQGDFFFSCRILEPQIQLRAENGDEYPIEIPVQEYDLIIISQSCDLFHGKIESVLVCPVIPIEDFDQSRDKKEKVRLGYMPGYHMLSSCDLDGFTSPIKVVNFRQVFSLPFQYVYDLAAHTSPRLRLLPPYREHLSQAFARFVMRVGLPVDIPPFK